MCCIQHDDSGRSGTAYIFEAKGETFDPATAKLIFSCVTKLLRLDKRTAFAETAETTEKHFSFARSGARRDESNVSYLMNRMESSLDLILMDVIEKHQERYYEGPLIVDKMLQEEYLFNGIKYVSRKTAEGNK